MLPAKLRTAKIQRKLFDPQGIECWQAPQVARGVVNAALKWMQGKATVEIDDLDALLIRSACRHLGLGAGIAFNPFSGGAALCGNVMTVPTRYLQDILKEPV